jgi:hypothetical protein
MPGSPEDKLGTTTRAGQRLMEVLLDPESESLTAFERAKKAGVSLRHYHRLLADYSFQAMLRAKAIEGLIPSARKILDASKSTAIEEKRDGFKDREMLLRMMAWYDPKSQLEVSGPAGGPIRVQGLSESELEALAEGRDDESSGTVEE